MKFKKITKLIAKQLWQHSEGFAEKLANDIYSFRDNDEGFESEKITWKNYMPIWYDKKYLYINLFVSFVVIVLIAYVIKYEYPRFF